MEKKGESSSSFPMGETAQEKGLPYVPECYKVQPGDSSKKDSEFAQVPILDLSRLNDPKDRSILVEEISNACRRKGFFQVINHGISQQILDGAITAASGFFKLSNKDKVKYMSNDVHKPVRYGTSIKDGVDKIQFWRVILKHYAHPLKDWIGLWPDNPHDYRAKMGDYTEATQKLAETIAPLITESLWLSPDYLRSKLKQGMQVMAVNGYPPCPQPQLALGLPPHSDYGCFTIVLQNSPGLQHLDSDDHTWRAIPVIQGALQVHVGDQLEVLSNGRYKSLVHRVTVNGERMRVSVAGLHTLAMDEKVAPAAELVGEGDVKRYKESCFGDFLNYISKNDIGDGASFLNTLKIDRK